MLTVEPLPRGCPSTLWLVRLAPVLVRKGRSWFWRHSGRKKYDSYLRWCTCLPRLSSWGWMGKNGSFKGGRVGVLVRGVFFATLRDRIWLLDFWSMCSPFLGVPVSRYSKLMSLLLISPGALRCGAGNLGPQTTLSHCWHWGGRIKSWTITLYFLYSVTKKWGVWA